MAYAVVGGRESGHRQKQYQSPEPCRPGLFLFSILSEVIASVPSLTRWRDDEATRPQTRGGVDSTKQPEARTKVQKAQEGGDVYPAALIEFASILNRLFGQCSQRYTELAARTDGHAADATTCRVAWPVISSKKQAP